MSKHKEQYIVTTKRGDEYNENRTTLTITHNGKKIAEHVDAGESEDNYFFRDWSWVPDALRDAYQRGVTDTETKMTQFHQFPVI